MVENVKYNACATSGDKPTTTIKKLKIGEFIKYKNKYTDQALTNSFFQSPWL